MILPHEWFSALPVNDVAFEQTFQGPDDQVARYWSFEAGRPPHMRRPWLDDAPEGGVPVEHGVPCGIHGDDAGVFTKEKVLACHFQGILSMKHLRLQRLLLFVMGYADIVSGVTLWQLYDVVAWSCHFLYRGVFPPTDHAGQPWPDGSWRSKVAGKPLTSSGLRGIWVQGEGDWKYVKETFNFRAYSRNACCHLCFASKVERPLWHTDVSQTAGWRANRITTDMYLGVTDE